MFLHYSLGTGLALLLCLAISAWIVSQSHPLVEPSVKATGSVAGAIVLIVISAVAVVALTFATFGKHKGNMGNQPAFTGCTEDSDHGFVFRDEKDGQDYVLLPSSISVKSGERVQILAKKDEDDAGRLALQVGKVVKDYGPCKPAPTPNAPAESH